MFHFIFRCSWNCLAWADHQVFAQKPNKYKHIKNEVGKCIIGTRWFLFRFFSVCLGCMIEIDYKHRVESKYFILIVLVLMQCNANGNEFMASFHLSCLFIFCCSCFILYWFGRFFFSPIIMEFNCFNSMIFFFQT